MTYDEYFTMQGDDSLFLLQLYIVRRLISVYNICWL